MGLVRRCHAVILSEKPEALAMPSIFSDHWYPVFEAASDEGTVLCCHVGSSSRSAPSAADAPAGVKMTLSSGDVGWIPYFLWRAEHVHDRHQGWTKHDFGPHS